MRIIIISIAENFISFPFKNSGCEAKDPKKSEFHHCIKKPNVEKTRKEVSVLDVGGKPLSIIPGKTHAIM